MGQNDLGTTMVVMEALKRCSPDLVEATLWSDKKKERVDLQKHDSGLELAQSPAKRDVFTVQHSDANAISEDKPTPTSLWETTANFKTVESLPPRGPWGIPCGDGRCVLASGE